MGNAYADCQWDQWLFRVLSMHGPSNGNEKRKNIAGDKRFCTVKRTYHRSFCHENVHNYETTVFNAFGHHLTPIPYSAVHQIRPQDVFVAVHDRISLVFQTMIAMNVQQQCSHLRLKGKRRCLLLGSPSMKSSSPSRTL